MQNEKRAVTSLWEDYRRGLAYQAALGLDRRLPMYVRFFEGDQWPRVTPATKTMPRPVVNIVKMIVRNKTSQLRASKVRMVYRSEYNIEDSTVAGAVERLNEFSEWLRGEMRMDELDRRALNDGAIKGTYIYHYYWDEEARGIDGVKDGALRCEVLDPLCVFFADPTERDEQKQKWILIKTRETVESVRAKADNGVDTDAITADEGGTYEDEYGRAEQDGDKMVTVLTRYFRRDGEVYFTSATKACVFLSPRPLAPDVEAARRELFPEADGEDGSDGMDPGNGSVPDTGNVSRETQRIKRSRAYLYPVVVGQYEEADNSIYGMGEVQGIIPAQKSINETLALSIYGHRMSQGGKWVVDRGALRDQVITNEIDQTLVDYTGTGNGIRHINGQAVNAASLSIVDALITDMRVVTGSTEVMTGESIGAGVSGAAYAQLQSQAMVPIEDLRDAVWRVKEKQALVEEQFARLFYHNRLFAYEERDASGAVPGTHRVSGVFDGSDYEGMDIRVSVEAVGGTRASAAGDIVLLDNLLKAGALTVDGYIQAYPEDAVSNKRKLLQVIREEAAGREAKLTAQLTQMQETMARYEAKVEQDKEAVDSVQTLMRENQELKKSLAQLLALASGAIRQANMQIQTGNNALKETAEDARFMAAELVKNGVVDGGRA